MSFGFVSGALAVVTGAGSGIGRATARRGAAAGLDVASWDLDAGSAERTVAEIADAGGRATWAQVDVTDPAAVATGFARSRPLGARPRQQRRPGQARRPAPSPTGS